MTLTHSCNTAWAQASPAENNTVGPDGLTDFGVSVVQEMNRLGMMVDISHVSSQTMMDAITASSAPVIASHSSARAVNDHDRNVPDQVLRMIRDTRGVVMVNFYSCYLIADCEDRPATVEDVVAHVRKPRESFTFNSFLSYFRSTTSGPWLGSTVWALVGTTTGSVPSRWAWRMSPAIPGCLLLSLETRSLISFHLIHNLHFLKTTFVPQTFDWSDQDLRKLAGENILRVFREVEKRRSSN